MIRWLKGWIVVVAVLACAAGCDNNKQSALARIEKLEGQLAVSQARVEKLEKQVVAFSSEITTKSIRVVGNDGTQLLLANKFLSFVDKNGTCRMELGLPKNFPALVLYDNSTKKRMGLSLDGGGAPWLVFLDKNGKGRMGLGRKALSMRDKNGKERVDLSFYNDNASLVLNDKNGTCRLDLGNVVGDPRLMLYDKNGKYRLGLGLSADDPGLSLWDKNGKKRMDLDLQSKGSPSLTLCDKDSKPRTVLGGVLLETTSTGAATQTAESNLTFFDKQGKVIGQIPR